MFLTFFFNRRLHNVNRQLDAKERQEKMASTSVYSISNNESELSLHQLKSTERNLIFFPRCGKSFKAGIPQHFLFIIHLKCAADLIFLLKVLYSCFINNIDHFLE